MDGWSSQPSRYYERERKVAYQLIDENDGICVFKVNGEAKKDGSEMIGCKRITLSNAPVTLISWGKRNFQLVKWTDSPKTS